MTPLAALEKRIDIHIGGVYASAEAAVVQTVLGSCVAACLFDPARRVGGMNHFFLPFQLDRHEEVPTRFGIHAMEVLINDIMTLGGDRRRLVAKVFGGASVLNINSAAIPVSEKNITFIREFLETERIPIISESLGGTSPRQVLFYTQTGRALMKAVSQEASKQVRAAEMRLTSRPKAPPPPEDDGGAIFF